MARATRLRPNQRQSIEYDRTVRMRRPSGTAKGMEEFTQAFAEHPVAFSLGIAAAGLVVGVVLGRYFFPAQMQLVSQTPVPAPSTT